MDQLLFGAYNLSSPKCFINSTNERSLPSAALQRAAAVRRDGSIHINKNYNEKTFQLRGILKKPTGHSPTFRDIENEFDLAMSAERRIFRRATNTRLITNADSTTGWSVSGDGANLTTNAYTYRASSAALSFDVDVSLSSENYVAVENSSLTAVDLSSVSETGNIEFFIYLPDTSNFSSLDVRWGNSSSHYWSSSGITSNYEGRTLENGWNYVSLLWDIADVTGTPNANAIDYLYVKLNYSADKSDMTGVLLNQFSWVDEDSVVNYVASVVTVDKAEGHSNLDYQPVGIELLANDPVAYSTHQLQIVDRDTIGSAAKTLDVSFGGSYNPTPRIVYTISTSSGLESIQFRNETTNEQMSIGTAFTANDTIEIDTLNLTCLLNGTDVDYEGVFPTHVVGLNKLQTTIATASSYSVEQFTYGSAVSGETVNRWYAQQFTTVGSGTLTSISAHLKRIEGFLENDVWFYLYTNNAGVPGTQLAELGRMTVGFGGDQIYTLGTNYPLAGVTSYWLVVKYLNRNLPQIYVTHWRRSDTDTYASNSIAYSDTSGASWTTDSSQDHTFGFTVEPPSGAQYDIDIFYKKRYL